MMHEARVQSASVGDDSLVLEGGFAGGCEEAVRAPEWSNDANQCFFTHEHVE